MRTLAAVLSLVLTVAAVGIESARAREISKKDLVFIGTVTAIANAKTGDPTRIHAGGSAGLLPLSRWRAASEA